MADIKTTKLDIDKIKKSPYYTNILNNIKSNPLKAFKELTVLTETSNPVTQLEDGKKLLEELKNTININPSDIQKEFEPTIQNKEVIDKINNNPKESYTKLYNAYTYEPMDINKKLEVRKALSFAKQKLYDIGTTPDEVINVNTNPFWSGLETLGNALSIPSNLLAKVVAKNPEKVKIWGGTGWEETLRQYNASPEIQELTAKVHKGIPLTQDESVKLKEFDDKYKIMGTIYNIVLDPTIIAGLAGKGLTVAGKAIKGITGGEKIGEAIKTVGTGFKAFAEPIKTYKEARGLIKLNESGKLFDNLKSILKAQKDDILKIPNINQESDIIKAIDSNLEMPKQQTITDNIIKTANIDNITKQIKSNNELLKANNITDNINLYNNALKNFSSKVEDIDKLTKSKIYSNFDKTYNKASRALSNFAEKSGIRKTFISDVPTQYKGAIDESRRLKSAYEADVATKQRMIKKAIQKAIPQLLKIKTIDDEVKQTKNINNIISELIEKPAETMAKYGIKQTKEIDNVINPVRETFDNYILTEAKYAGSKAKPMLPSQTLKEWEKLADQYKALNIENKYSPRIKQIENQMRQILKNKLPQKALMDEGIVKEIADNNEYLTHAMTKEAKELYLNFEGDIRNILGFSVRSAINNPSFKQRYIKGTVSDINKSIKNGDYSKAIREEAEKIKDIEPSKSEGLIKLADEIDKYFVGKEVDLFDTDVAKLIGIRGARTAKTVEQSSFYDAVKEFASDKKMNDGIRWKKINEDIAGLKGKYFHPDVADAIDEMYKITKDQKALSKVKNLLQDFSNMWKGFTLGIVPSTAIRNAIGNFMNQMLISNPADIIRAMKDSFLGIAKGDNYKILSKNGSIMTLQDLIKEASNRGIISSTFQNIDTGLTPLQKAERTKAESITGKGLEKVSGFFQTIGNAFRNSPVSLASNKIESIQKLGTFIDEFRKGKSLDEAAQQVYKVMFDYGDLTKAEKEIRNIMPFFTWTRKNLPLQIMNIASTPSKALLKTTIGMNRPTETEESKGLTDKRFMSEWMRDKAKIPFGVDIKTGNPNYILLEGLFPLFDVDRLIRAYVDQRNIIDDLIADTLPLVKTPIENIMNYSFALKKPISKGKFDQVQFLGFYMSPYLKNVLKDWRIATLANKGLDLDPATIGVDKKSIETMLLSAVIGNTIPYDPTFSRIIESGQAKQEIQKEIGAYETFGNKLKQAIANGQTPSKKDADIYYGRAGKILQMIRDTSNAGKLDANTRKFLNRKVITVLLGKDFFKKGKYIKPKKLRQVKYKSNIKLQPLKVNNQKRSIYGFQNTGYNK